MCKTYHEAKPDATICVFDPASSIGGVWAKEKIYPGLKTNNVIGSFEFSDFPMIPSRYGLQRGDHIPGEVVHQYMNDAVEYFDIHRYLRLETEVDSAELNNDGQWIISYHRLDASGTPTTHQFIAGKLVLATGLTSEPYIPTFNGRDQFEGVIMHSRDLHNKMTELTTARSVVVLGANKSAWDSCYSVASRGGKAHMIIRPSGGGPSWVWPKSLGRWNASASSLSSTRFYSLFDPWPFETSGLTRWVRQLLHRWTTGRWITIRFWTTMDWLLRRHNRYVDDATTANLAPWYSTYWMGNSLSVHNYDSDWYELVRKGNIQVHIADVESLSAKSAQLSDGSIVDADVLMCCTGWKAELPIQLRPSSVLEKISLPGGQSIPPAIALRAREEVLCERPFLSNGPSRRIVDKLGEVRHEAKSGQLGPYALYRYLVPFDAMFMRLRNFAFLGYDLSVHATMVAQAQALWITAFFNDKIGHLSQSNIDYDRIKYETALHVEYGRLRRPRSAGGHGARFPDMVFESIPYIDMLLRDLEMRTSRKQGFFANMFYPYRLPDYRGLVQEWKLLQPRAC